MSFKILETFFTNNCIRSFNGFIEKIYFLEKSERQQNILELITYNIVLIKNVLYIFCLAFCPCFY